MNIIIVVAITVFVGLATVVNSQSPAVVLPCTSTFQCANYSASGSGDVAFACTQCISGFCEETVVCPEGFVCFNDITGACTGDPGDLTLCSNDSDCEQTSHCSQCFFTEDLGFCRTLFDCPLGCDLESQQCVTPPAAPSTPPTTDPSAPVSENDTPGIVQAGAIAVGVIAPIVGVTFILVIIFLVCKLKPV